MARKFVFRIDQEGVEELRRNLERLGKDGQKAFRDLSQASPQLANPLTQAERRIEATRRSLERLGRQGSGHLRSLGREAGFAARNFIGLSSPIAALAGTAGLGLLARRALEFTDNLQESASALGLNVEQLQEYRFGAGQTGLGVDKLNQGLAIFEKKMADAKDGQKEAVELFKQWKLPILEADGSLRSLGAVLPEFAERVRTAESPAKALQIVMEAFGGKLGKDFVNFFKDGAAGIDNMSRAARISGAVMSESLVNQGALAKDQLDALGLTIRTNFNVGLLQGFVGEFGSFTELAKDPNFQRAIQDLGRELGEIVRLVVQNGPAMAAAFADLAEYIRVSADEARALLDFFDRLGRADFGGPATGTRALIRTPDTTAEVSAQIAELQRQLGVQQDIKRDPYWLVNIIGLTDANIAALEGKIGQLQGVLGQAKEDTLRQQLGAGQTAPAAGVPPPAWRRAPTSDGPFGFPVVTGTGGGGTSPIDQETRAREQALAAIDQMIQGYREEAQLLGLGSAEREKQQALFQAEEILRRANLVLTEQQRQALISAVGAQQEAAAQADRQATAQDRVNQILEEYARIQEAALNPAERYAAMVSQLRADLAANAISQGQFNAAMAALPEVTAAANDNINQTENAMQGLVDTTVQWSVALGRSGNLLQLLQQQLLQLLATAASESINQGLGLPSSATASSGGLLGLLGGLIGLGGNSAAISTFYSPAGASLLPSIFHGGGIAGEGGGMSRSVAAAAFLGAPRLHDGYGGAGSPFRPGEFPAILQKNEAVIPLIGGAVPVRLMGERRGREGPRVVNNYYVGAGQDNRRPTGRQQMGELVRTLQRGSGR